MKLFKSILLAIALLVSVTGNVAWAGHGQAHFVSHRSFHQHPGWGRGHGHYWGVGLYGAAWPWYYPWYYGYVVPVLPYSAYSEAAAPVDYIEINPAPATNDASENVWYYCQNPQGYYPYVKSCAGGWQKVPVQPPK